MQDKSVRCDGCGAEAWVTVKKPLPVGIHQTGTLPRNVLDFCVHHYNQHSTVLHAEGWTISNDERDTINLKPSISANAV